MTHLQRHNSSVWGSHLMGLGTVEPQFCLHIRIVYTQKTLCETTLWDSVVINILEKCFIHLHIQRFSPLGFSQQYEDQQDTPD